MPTVICAKCKILLNEDYNVPENLRKPCPKCGSLSRHSRRTMTGDLGFHKKLKLKARHGSKGKPFFESIFGSDLYRKLSKWMRLQRTIDRKNDHYLEIITDPETGDVIHFCDEPLSKHKGHGSVKYKKKK